MRTPVRCLLLVCLCVLMTSSSWGHYHFRGGSTSFQFIDTSDPKIHKVEMVLISGWSLNLSPCGINCNDSAIGTSTVQSRQEMINTYGDPTLFGNWTLEVLDRTGNILQTDFTANVNSHIHSTVSNLNTAANWLQEIAHFQIDIDTSYPYTDVVLNGLSWVNLTIQGCNLDKDTNQCPYHLQQKIKPGYRSDTKQPNQSPILLVKPVYRVKINEVTRIPIAVADIDGDKVTCHVARWVALSHVNAMPNTTVTPDCVVSVGPFPDRSDGDWGLVNVLVEDMPLRTITMGKYRKIGLKDTLSTAQVEFLIQTFEKVMDPLFVLPTTCVNGSEHVSTFFVYSGSYVTIPIYAQPHPDGPNYVEIDRFHVTMFPQGSIDVSKPVEETSRASDRVKSSHIEWLVGANDVGHYLLQAIAVDSEGMDSKDCSFHIEVKALNEIAQPKSNDIPYFPLFPKPDAIQCLKDSFCTFPIYAKTIAPNTKITDIHIVNGTFPSTQVSGMSQVTHNGEQMTKADVTVASNKTGPQNLCIEVKDDKGLSVVRCVDVKVVYIGPCIKFAPCGDNGLCNETGSGDDDFVCTCYPGWTGQKCETRYNPCDHNYCGKHSSMCGFIPVVSPLPLCLCKDSFTGPKCETPPYPCYDITCKNLGVCSDKTFPTMGCLCPVGFEGKLCSNVTTFPGVSHTAFTDLVGPTNGGWISCLVDTPCSFSVNSLIDTPGSIPAITTGSHPSEVFVTLGPSHGDSVTAVPGLILTPVSALSHHQGNKSVCFVIQNSQTSNSSVCYNLEFVDNVQASVNPPPSSAGWQPQFQNPTPPGGSTLPCTVDLTGCRFLVSTDPSPQGKCSVVTVTAGDGAVFDHPAGTTSSPASCTNEVLVIPTTSGTTTCLKAGIGEERCFKVPQVPKSGTQLCSSQACGPHGHCLADPVLGGTTCACDSGLVQANCSPNTTTTTQGPTTTTGPCIRFEPCGHYGICHEYGPGYDDFVCVCFPGQTGKKCEVSFNPCDHNYCGKHSAKCGFIPELSPLPACLCMDGFTGPKCETPPESSLSDCTKPIDLVFVLDSSSSESLANFMKQIYFAGNITQKLTIGPMHVQVSALSYSSLPHNVFYLNEYDNKIDVLNALAKTPYHPEVAYTDEALRFVRRETLSTRHGRRLSAQPVVVIVTYQKSSDKAATLAEAQSLQSTGAMVIVIGIGEKTDDVELSSIASDPSHKFEVKNFDSLVSIQYQIFLKICEKSSK